MLLHGKSALITGASRGIGKAIAEKFASEGIKQLVICARNPDLLNALKSDLESKHDLNVLVAVCDVGKQEDIKSLFATIQHSGVSLDIMVNAAGVMKDASLMMAGRDLYESNFNTNVAGTIFVTQQAIKHFIRKKSGSVINFGSIVGIDGSAGQSIYAASKAAVIGFTKSLSKELAPFSVKVNAIAPGFIDTEMISSFNTDQRAKVIENIGFKRTGTPEEVANVALFLASDLSSYITGQVIGIDGGMVI